MDTVTATIKNPDVHRVLAGFVQTVRPTAIEPLRSSGFSGAELWRITSPAGLFCLRRWPREYPTQERLHYMHHVLRQVFQRGVTEVAVPLADSSGQTMVACNGSLWELSPWMPGTANFHVAESATKLAEAMRLLARFHLAADWTPPLIGSPAGIASRLQQLKELMAGGFSDLQSAMHSPSNSLGRHVSSPTAQKILFCAQQFLRSFPVLAPGIRKLLEHASRYSTPIQPCIRDVWHDHLLFTGDQVTGLIDFGSMRDDHIASDISRLLGSLVRNDQAGWTAGIAAYERLRPLSAVDMELISVYDRSGVLLSAMNWLRWLYLENRQFEDYSRVQQRCTEIASRLCSW